MANFIYTSYEGVRGPVAAAYPHSIPATIVQNGYEITIPNARVCWGIHVQYSCGHPVLEETQEASAAAAAAAVAPPFALPTVEQMVSDNSIQYAIDDYLAAVEREGNNGANIHGINIHGSVNDNFVGNFVGNFVDNFNGNQQQQQQQQQQQPPPPSQQQQQQPHPKPLIIEFIAHRRAGCTYKCVVEQMAHRLQAKCTDCAYWGPNGQWRRDYEGPMFREFLNSLGPY